MKNTMKTPTFVTTISEKCRICYTCIRQCPSKAIRIKNGQAEIIKERCISCGNCIKVCSQKAKVPVDYSEEIKAFFDSKLKKVAIVAPSFPAEFTDLNYMQLVGMIKILGFDLVCEVAYGADSVASNYKKLLLKNPNNRYISSTCPAITNYVRKYHPLLVENLAPIDSPMIATAKILKEKYGTDLKIAFIGPCIAKKTETEFYPDVMDIAITFLELRKLFEQKNIQPQNVLPMDFDPPHPGKGLVFPINQGLIEAANLDNDLIENKIISAEGSEFIEALREFETKDLDVVLLDLLSCEGCIMGPGINSKIPKYSKIKKVSDYAKLKYYRYKNDKKEDFSHISLKRQFDVEDQRLAIPSSKDLQKIMKKMGKEKPEDELNCGACGYSTCIEHAIAVYHGLAESEMCLPYTIEKLNNTSQELRESYKRVSSMQETLIHTEKLASMGQLSAGIAHEVNNPLGVVILFANILKDSIPKDSQMYSDVCKIVEESERCRKIVSGLLDFSRKNKLKIKKVKVNELLKNCLELIKLPSNIQEELYEYKENFEAEIDPDAIVQVITNLIKNAADAIQEEKGEIEVSILKTDNNFSIIVKDTGKGIKKENLNKIFEPFFTTKTHGKGTGLGLAVSYGIIKMHYGQISVTSNTDKTKGPTGTEFKITLPLKNKHYEEN